MTELASWKVYQGASNKPENFDEFWDEKIKLVNNYQFEFELIEKKLPSRVAHFYHLWFKAIDGAKIHAQLIVPKNLNQKYPAIIQFHGYHCDSGDWVDKIGIVAEGNVVLALDCRGQGGLSQDNTETSGMTLKGLIVRGIDEGYGNLYYVRQFMDLMSATKILANFDFVDETNISAQGASQGGGLAIACAALSPFIKKVTATYPFLSDYRKAYELGAEESAFEELPYWFQFKDPLHQKEDWFFNQLEYIDIQNLAPRIRAEVIWILGGKDTVVPPITQIAAYNKIQSKKTLYVLPEYGHEYLPKISDWLRENQ